MAPCPDPKGLPRPTCCGWRPGWLYRVSGPDPKGLPRPKMSLELALAMLQLAPWLVLSGFKTDGWPPVPIPKASPGPNCRWSWRPHWFYRVSKLTDGPLSRSQRPPRAQNVFGAGFSHAAAGALATFIGFQN